MTPASTRSMRQRKTVVRNRLAWIPVALLVGFAAISCSSAQLWATPTPPKVASKGACAEKFMAAITDKQSAGLYACLSGDAKVRYFDKFGWQNDGDIQQWINTVVATGSGYQKKTFGSNPVPECLNRDSSGNCTKQGHGYHYYIGVIAGDGTVDWLVGTGLDVVLDDQGKIAQV